MRRDLAALVASAQRAVWAGESSEYLLPDLREIAEVSVEGCEEWCFAIREIALRTADVDPWGAALIAKKLVAIEPRDHVGWAVLGLAHSLLGNLRYALAAYERALAVAPMQPHYAHNYGHLLDVIEGDPARALPYLERAHEASPRCIDTALSLAHALVRVSRGEEALALLNPSWGLRRDQRRVAAWVERQARQQAKP